MKKKSKQLVSFQYVCNRSGQIYRRKGLYFINTKNPFFRYTF